MSKTAKIVLGVGLAVALIIGFGVYWVALRDTAEKSASLDAIGGGNAPTTAAGSSAKTSPDGTWKVSPIAGVFVGYRMEEQFASATIKKVATGRTPAVEGTMTIEGSKVTAVDIKADMTQLKSDEDRRDAQVRNRGLETAKFGEATFKLTSPVDLPANLKQGEEVSITATGDLTLHGATHSVDVPLKAKWNGDTIIAATAGDGVAITLSDWNIDKIDVAGFVTIDDHGTFELQLNFIPA